MSRVGKKDCRVEKKKQGGLKKTNPGLKKIAFHKVGRGLEKKDLEAVSKYEGEGWKNKMLKEGFTNWAEGWKKKMLSNMRGGREGWKNKVGEGWKKCGRRVEKKDRVGKKRWGG